MAQKSTQQLRDEALDAARKGQELPKEDVVATTAHPVFGVPTFAGQTRPPYALKGGGFGVTAIVASVPIGPITVAVNVAVKHDPKKPADKNVEIVASKPAVVSFGSAAETDEFLGYVEEMASNWVGFDDAYNAALRAIRGAYGVKPIESKPGSFERGRLVRSAKIEIGAAA